MLDVNDPDRLLNIEEVAELLGWSVRTVENHLLSGEFLQPTVRIGKLRRWWRRAVIQWIKEKAEQAVDELQVGRPRTRS